MAFSTTAKVVPPLLSGGYSFTPTLRLGGVEISTQGGTYGTRTGYVNFIAPGLMWVSILLPLTAKGTGTGAVRVQWPTTTADGTAMPTVLQRAAMAIEILSLAGSTTITQVSGTTVPSDRAIELARRSGSSGALLDAADIVDFTTFRLSGMVPYTL